MAQFNFDPVNFGLGAASGVLTTVVVQRIYRFAREMGNDRERAVVRTYASREADKGYLLALVDYARQEHLLGMNVRLDDILIEPRFIPPPPIVSIPDPDVPLDNIFDGLPQVHDYPHLHAPYNIPSLSIADLSRGANKLALVGVQGSGRTTALLSIALWSAGYIEFTPEPDEIIAELEANLDPKKDVPLAEQVLRVRRRVAMSEVSRARYRAGFEEEDTTPKDPTEEDDTVPIEVPSRFREIAPVYVHMADIMLESGEYGQYIDPAEPLVRALQQQAGWLSSKRLVNKTYKLLENSSCLVLIDGYDDIANEKRPNAIRWMRSLMDLYPDNYFVVAMPPEGYGLLMESGAVPVFLKPWDDQAVSDNTDKLAQEWETMSKTPIEFSVNDYEVLENYLAEVKEGARQLHALDSTLRTWTIFKGMEETTYSEQMQAYLENLMPDVLDIMPELQRMATIQLDKGFVTIRNLIDYALQKVFTGEEPELVRTITGEIEVVQTSTSDVPVVDEDKEKAKIRNQVENEQGKLLSKLVKAGILRQFRGGRYQFRHKILASYLAALELAEASEYIVFRKFNKPDWEYAMNYLAELRDVDFLVAEQIDNVRDVRHEKMLRLATWLRFAGEDVPWRTNLLRYLGNLFATPNQFTVVRERIAAALVGASDVGARVVFRQGLKTSNSDVRRLSCLALGALKDKGAIEALSQVVFQDPAIENKIAGTMALLAIGTADSFEVALEMMDITPHEEVRRAVTENLAANHAVGFPTLHDMLASESIAMRRAALFGVGRVPRDWSWLLIDSTYQKDTESFVRLAAEVVSRQKFDSYFYELESYPLPTEAPWFVEWMEYQKEQGFIPYDTEAEDVLASALSQTDDIDVRWLMTGTIGQLGQYDMLEEVYQALKDDDNLIRDRAYRTLAEFQEKLGKAIPVPSV
ncbi:MAG: hypothetical protein Phog2KO_08080 [Phototrophicaceae bacterium]